MARYFTVGQANSTLGTIRPLIAQMLAIRQKIIARDPDIWPSFEKAIGNGGNKTASALVLDFQRLEELVKQVQATGAILKDINTGLVDFPALRDGEEIYLCWRYGEDEVRFWHGMDAGFSGRQAL